MSPLSKLNILHTDWFTKKLIHNSSGVGKSGQIQCNGSNYVFILRDWFHHVKKNLSKLVLHDCKQMLLGVYFDVAVTAAAERKGGGNANE